MTNIKAMGNERALLSCFFNDLKAEDPDVIVAHNLYGFDIEVLLQRSAYNNVGAWSRLGRLRKSKAPT